MGSVIIINGSPRPERSNSKRYAAMFTDACPLETTTLSALRSDPNELRLAMQNATDALLVFPLYVDGIPSTLLSFLKMLEEHGLDRKPRISVLINCGFIEPQQCDVAVSQIRLFCGQLGYPFGSVLEIGAGEAILTTPFRPLVRWHIGQLARAIERSRHRFLRVSMPLPKRVFVRASEGYWTAYGERYGTTREQMATERIP